MITPLIDIIKKYIRLTEHDIAEIEARSKLKTFSKEDFLRQAGEVAKEMCFVLSGIFKVYAPDPNGREITYIF